MEATVTYTVHGMSCDHCREAVTRELRAVPGVTAVEVDLERKRVTVAGSGLDDEALRAAIDDAGYDVPT